MIPGQCLFPASDAPLAIGFLCFKRKPNGNQPSGPSGCPLSRLVRLRVSSQTAGLPLASGHLKFTDPHSIKALWPRSPNRQTTARSLDLHPGNASVALLLLTYEETLCFIHVIPHVRWQRQDSEHVCSLFLPHDTLLHFNQQHKHPFIASCLK